MKTWRVDYSVKNSDGEITELEKVFEATGLLAAYALAEQQIRQPLLKMPDVADVVIWGVTIIDDDVF